MSDSLTITADVVDGQPITGSSGDSVVINSSVIESTAVNGEVATGAKGDKGDTGDTGPAGADAPSDHTLLTSIGTNTHAQIDTAISDSVSHIANTSNPHIVTKAQVGLSNVPNTDFTADVAANTAKISFDAVSSARLANTSGTNTGDQDLSGYSLTSHNHTGVYAPVLGADDNYVTDAEKVVIGNTSGTNTGDNATNTQYSGLAASKQDADATLTSLAAYNTNGLLTQTAADTFAGRTITGTANQVTVTNGDGVSGNPTLSLPQNIDTSATPTFSSLTAGTATDVLGTALSVIRNNVAVGRIDNNASGLRVQAQNGSLQLRGTGNTGIAIDASGNAVVAGTITGANLSGTNTGDQPLGSRTITGTANQVTVTNGNGVSGNPTLALPQDIHTGASPTFAGVTSTGLTATQIVATDGAKKLQTLTTATYPSLTELSYVKGLTSSVQNQLNTNTITTTRLVEPTSTLASATPVTSRPLFDILRGDHTAFLPAEQIIIEQSVDGGITWTDAGVSDVNKQKLFSGERPNIYIPQIAGVMNTLCMLRVTISAMRFNVPGGTAETDKYSFWTPANVLSAERYCTISEAWVWLSSINNRIQTTIERANGATPNSWSTIRTAYMNGWSGGDYASIPGGTFGGATVQTGNAWHYRFTFRTASPSNTLVQGDLGTGYTTQTQKIHHIKTSGQDIWTVPNRYAYNEHIYSWDYLQNVTFPADVKATSLSLNATAYISGATAGQLTFTGNLAAASNYGSDLGTSGGAFATVRAGVFRADYSVGLALSDASNIQFGTVTGTKIGTATNQKLGFFNATPVVQPSATPVDATDLATALTLVNDLKSKLVTLGLIA